MRNLAHVLFFTIITILIAQQVNLVHGEDKVKNDLVKSIDALKKALKIEPSNVEGHYYLGICIRELIEYFKIDAEDVVVFHDDLDVDFSKIKTKFGGSKKSAYIYKIFN